MMRIITIKMFNSSINFLVANAKKLNFMIVGEDKQKDLIQLERFVSATEVPGFVSNLWYSYLRYYYPVEFMKLVKKHPVRGKVIPYFLEQAEKQVNALLNTVSAFLVKPPGNDMEKKQFDTAIRKLVDIIANQAKYN